MLTYWHSRKCDFYFVHADRIRKSKPADFPKMLRLQDMPRDWIVKREIALDAVCRGQYVSEYLAVSQCALPHRLESAWRSRAQPLEESADRPSRRPSPACGSRWEQREDPDPTGAQLDALKTFLLSAPEIKWVFYDMMSLAQARRATV